jgi:branched-chain amino acid aminotransferase
VLEALTTLKGIQQGKIKDTFGWLEQVVGPQGYKQKTAANSGGLERCREQHR